MCGWAINYSAIPLCTFIFVPRFLCHKEKCGIKNLWQELCHNGAFIFMSCFVDIELLNQRKYFLKFSSEMLSSKILVMFINNVWGHLFSLILASMFYHFLIYFPSSDKKVIFYFALICLYVASNVFEYLFYVC